MTVRRDDAGVTGLVRSVGINPASYTRLLNFYQSGAVDLPGLTRLWTALALRLFADRLFLLKGRIVLVGDGIKVAKEGLRMPAVRLLRQSSGNNSKAGWIMGHSLQALSVLVASGTGIVAVPLACGIHEGIRRGPGDRRTLTDKFFRLFSGLGITGQKGAYLVADSYYCCGALAGELMSEGVALVTRVRKNAVAFIPAGGYSGRGRPAKYGDKIKLWDLFADLAGEMAVSVYSGAEETVGYGVFDLMWKSYGDIVRFCLVDHPVRGRIILMSPDTSLTAAEMLEAYAYRFKIEYSFKELVHVVGAFLYRFWSKKFRKTRRGDGDRYTHREPREVKNKIEAKLFAYHLHIQMALIAHGLLQYLAACYGDAVWGNFGGWLRTIRPGLSPSSKVVQESLKNTLGDFRRSLPDEAGWQKFAKSLWGIPPPSEEKPPKAA